MPFAKFSPPQVRHNYKGIQDGLGLWIPHHRFQIPSSRSLIRRTWIRDSNRQWESGFLELYFRFQSQGFRILQTKISGNRIPDSGFWIPQAKIFLDSRMLYTEWNFSPWVVLSRGTVCHVSTRRLLHPASPPASTSTFYLRAWTDFMYVNC